MRVMSKKEGGGLISREEGKGGWEACVKGRREGGMGGLCQGKKGRGDGRLVSREEGKGGWEAYVKGRREGGMGGLCRGKKGRGKGGLCQGKK